MPTYKCLSEYNTCNSAKESYSRLSNHLAFLQGNPKDSRKACYKCGNPGYTVMTCPVCNSERQSKPAHGAMKNVEYSFKPNKSKKVFFETTVKKQGKKKCAVKHA